MSRIFSGIQPSGELHIGNYLGAVKNWVELQRSYESFFCVVDYHAITIPYEPDDLRTRRREMMVSLLAAGLDPSVARCSCSRWCRNIPNWRGYSTRSRRSASSSGRRSSRRRRRGRRAFPPGMLNYPVLQAADILLYRADLVPVGEDQVQHLELSREIARRWNARFGGRGLSFPSRKAKLTPSRRIMGLDGKAKMSKSLGNTVGLLEEPESIWEKLRPAVTDPRACGKTDPGTPEVCNIYHLHTRSARPTSSRTSRRSVGTRGLGVHRLQEGAVRER